MHPVIASFAGAAAHAVTMSLGNGYTSNYAGIAVVGVVVAALVGSPAWSGGPTALERMSLGLGIVAGVLVGVWWSGWPHVFGLTAAGLAVEHRRRVGSFSAVAGIGLGMGLLGLVASGVYCAIPGLL